MKVIKDFLQDQRSAAGFMRDEEGVTAIEYGLIAALIAVVIITSVELIGVRLDAVFDRIGNALPAA